MAIALAGCGAQITSRDMASAPQGAAAAPLPMKVGLHVGPDARDYAVDKYSMHFDAGSRVAAEAGGQLGRAFQSVALINQPSGVDRSVDLVVDVQQPTLTVTQTGLAEVTEKLVVPFTVATRDGATRAFTEETTAVVSMGDLNPAVNIAKGNEALRDIARSDVIKFVGQLTAEAASKAPAPGRGGGMATAQGVDEAMAKGAAAEHSGDLAGALAIYTGALQKYATTDLGSLSATIDRAIDVALEMKPRPAIPAAATRHANTAVTRIKAARTNDDFEVARLEYQNALAAAPWWADAWFNLAALDEQMGAPAAAANDLTFYLRAAPDAPDKSRVQRKTEALQGQAAR